jgi:hypothetical protein
MREIGIDLSTAKPERLTDELARSASVLITMGCGEACPLVPGLRTVDWAVLDPKGQSLNEVRAIRNEIHERVKELCSATSAPSAWVPLQPSPYLKGKFDRLYTAEADGLCSALSIWQPSAGGMCLHTILGIL